MMKRTLLQTIGWLLLGTWLQTLAAAAADLSSCLTPTVGEQTPNGEALDQWLAETATHLAKATRTIAPEEAYELLAILDLVGFDPKGLRAWVAEHTGYIPYSGILRGARGVLIERRGNSLDRALLLAELILAGGGDVRLAQAAPIAVKTRAIARPQANDQALGIALLPAAQRATAQAGLARRTDCDAATRARITHLTTRLLKMLGQSKAPATANHEDAYWWVQVKEGKHWSDLFLDSFDGPAPSAQRTHEPGRLPAERYHAVRFRFIAEVWDGRRVKHHILLQHSAHAADLVGRSIHIQQRPEATPALATAMEAADIDGLLTAIDLAPVWTPSITIADQSHRDRAISLDGRIAKANPAGLARLGSEAVKGAAALGGTGGSLLTGAFGGGGRGSLRGKADNDPRPALLAEWLEITISAPGEKPHTERRTLLDSLADRRPHSGKIDTDQVREATLSGRGLALLTNIEAAMIGFDPSPAYLAHTAAEVAATAVATATTIRAGDKIQPRFDRQFPFLAFANARMQMGGAQVHAGRANLILVRNILRRTAKGDWSVLRNADIIDNRISYHGSDKLAFRERLRQGVADTVLENRLLGDAGLRARNAANLMADADRRWRRIVPEDPDVLKRLDMPAKLHQQLRQNLQQGHVLVVPEDIGDVAAYWRIDPRSGTTLGIGTDGRGTATTERAITLKQIYDSGKILADFGFFLGCLAAYEADALEGGGDMAVCLTAAALFATGGPIMSNGRGFESIGIYVAGWITQYAGLGIITWLGVDNYTFRNWLRELLGF